MASCFAQGRLGTELNNLPLWFLWKYINHTPIGDSLLEGESLDVIIKRIAKLSNTEIDKVEKEVKETIRKRREKEEPEASRQVKEPPKKDKREQNSYRREQVFLIGTPVKEKTGTWRGYTCGWYKTPEVPEGYVVMSYLNPIEVKTYRVDELVRWDKSREN